MKRYNVLVTSVGSTTAIGIIKFIQKSSANVFVIGTDINDENRIAGSSFCQAFYQIPPYYNESYITRIEEIVCKHKVDFIIPVHDQELEKLSRHREQLNKHNCKIISSSISTIELVNNKYSFAQLLQNKGISTPKTFAVADWLESTEEEENKWLLKPINGVSGRGILIGNRKEIKSFVDSVETKSDFIIQEYITGIEYTIDVFVKNKVPYCIIPRIRKEVREGLCYKAATVSNSEFIYPVESIVKLLDFYGPINLQFIKDEVNGRLYCIECNPRFGGSSIITLRAGVNLFDFIINDFENQQLVSYDNYKIVYMARYWEEVFYEN